MGAAVVVVFVVAAIARACMHAGAHARRSQEHGVTHKYTSIFAKRRLTCIYTGINDCLCMYAASPESLLLADTLMGVDKGSGQN